jgi:phenylacetate-CoA ligase
MAYTRERAPFHSRAIVAKDVSGKDLHRLAGIRRLPFSVKYQLRDALNVSPKVTRVEPGALPRSEGKAVRVIDKRRNR